MNIEDWMLLYEAYKRGEVVLVSTPHSMKIRHAVVSLLGILAIWALSVTAIVQSFDSNKPWLMVLGFAGCYFAWCAAQVLADWRIHK